MKSKYKLLVVSFVFTLLVTGCNTSEMPDVQTESHMEDCIEESTIYESIEGLPEYNEYAVSFLDFSRYKAADSLTSFGELDNEPVFYIGHYDGSTGEQSNYTEKQSTNDALDYYMLNTDTYRIEMYLVQENDLYPLLYPVKTDIDEYLINHNPEEPATAFLNDLSDNIKLGTRKWMTDYNKVSPHIQKNMVLFYEYTDIESLSDINHDKEMVLSLSICIAAGNGNYIIIWGQEYKQTDALYEDIVNEPLFLDWITEKLSDPAYEAGEKVEQNIADFMLRLIPAQICHASEQDVMKH